VLILSRFAGAARECEATLLVNPYDPDSVAAAIGRALSMPLEERRARHKVLFEVLSRNDVRQWANRFLDELVRTPVTANRLGQIASAGA
jgi:trehalose 6-phosphate synthase